MGEFLVSIIAIVLFGALMLNFWAVFAALVNEHLPAWARGFRLPGDGAGLEGVMMYAFVVAVVVGVLAFIYSFGQFAVRSLVSIAEAIYGVFT